MLNIGLLGLGTVGQGILEIISQRKDELRELLNKEIRVKKILVKDINKERDLDISKEMITDDFQDILSDESIDLIIEVTGDLEEVYEYIKESLNSGRHVVTANKAIVSKYFEELTDLALKNKVAFLYEASVAGGIPVLKSLKENITLNKIDEIQGILNGTCNYILTSMFDENLGYDEVLKMAQDLGYAEADPAADVEGLDTLRKLRILATLGLQVKVLEKDIVLEGIDKISSFDIEEIKKLNSTVKLIGQAKYYKDGYIAMVLPTIVKDDSYFATVNKAFNSVAYQGNHVGDLKFYGPGAGKLPTANAVLTDVLDIALGNYRKNNPLGSEELHNYNYSMEGSFYLRIPKGHKDIGDRLQEIRGEVLAQGDYMAIKTKPVKLGKIYETLKLLEINKEDYFLAKFAD